MLRICSLFALTLTLSFGAASAQGISGAVRVIDGDTFDVGDTRVRLHGIDALEAAQTCETEGGQPWACGDWTTRQVRDRYQGAQARCEALDRDRYDRVVARCFVGGADVGRMLVQEGLAFAYRKYAMDYDLDEKAAFVAERGIHGFKTISPARYRVTRRSGAEPARAEGSCQIKGNISAKGTKIYHLPGQDFYSRTRINTGKGERWFCSEAEARGAGWRRARR
ncbi:thermonuclease family protein [Sulfitobacter delicatus]|uniref:Endonuclease YncB, thermonuclease family n=1 Tax=Sulfitobacter delicatus TaxID=218672 RepID=A0A1G7LUJ6_9RHOB|nr:thermonuclease family protein [Sulfitobacter delicatus]SDF53248.1 Endonuclease YncB, thermonuclease family [Sulfitobacter delicatus]